ncbi:MAG TPA: DUF192 domain-containing protein [Longimicrobiales bacterium]|nr:DUF192 domain-containing protein [Longimicrobiales bacterium]
MVRDGREDPRAERQGRAAGRIPVAHSRLQSMVAAVLVLATLVAACERGEPAGEPDYRPVVVFDTARAVITTGADTFALNIDVAEREDQRAYGLMERTALPDDTGMVFLYPHEQPADAGFWMWRTRIALDIAFFDEEGTILTILQMEPCPHADPRGCPTYPPGVAYHGALEVNRGYFAARGIGPGDRITVER